MAPLPSTPIADGFRMPGEFEPHAACWMAWPQRPDNWRMGAAPAQGAYAAVARAVAASEPLGVTAAPGSDGSVAAALEGVARVAPVACDDAWMRDIGPTFVVGDHEVRGVDWQFNAWGGERGGLYSSWERDAAMARAVCDLEGVGRYAAPLVLEGGAIHVDGEGALLTTEECLLNPNRNPSLSRAEIEELLRWFTGADAIVWLDRGVVDDETDGHVDNLCCFAAPGVVLLTWTDDTTDPQYERSLDARRRLESVVDAHGRALDVRLLPQPGPLFITAEEADGVVPVAGTKPRHAGDRLAASYVNYYPANDTIVMPLLDVATDDEATDVLAKVFPERLVVGVEAREILLGGGNIHCITQPVPSPGEVFVAGSPVAWAAR